LGERKEEGTAVKGKKSLFLKGKNIGLRALDESDIDGPWFEWFNDPEICRFTAHGRLGNTYARMKEHLERVSTSNSIMAFAIIELSSNAHVGVISLQDIQWVDRWAELAIVLGERKVMGKGYSKEAGELLLRHAFLEVGLNRIQCGTFADNEPMIKLAKHLGMKEEGRRRLMMFRNGTYHDVLEYGVLRDEFLKR
jgi:ribosomal-protein-alanine N-acetyltransferase